MAKQFEQDVLETFKWFHSKFVDSVHNGQPTLAAFRRHGVIRSTPVHGRRIVRPFLNAESFAVQPFRGYQQINTPSEEPLDGFEYRWVYNAMPMGIAETDILENSGKEEIIDLVSERMTIARLAVADFNNSAVTKLKATHATNKKVTNDNRLHDGIPDIVFVASGGTTVGENTIGGIDRSSSAYSNVKNQGVAAGSDQLTSLDQLVIDCTRDGVTPSLIGCGKNGYRILANKIRGTVNTQGDRPASGKPAMFQSGFRGVMHDGAEVYFDHSFVEDSTIGNTATTEGVAYVLSTEFLHYIEAKPWAFKLLGWEKPRGGSDVIAREAKILMARAMFHDLHRTCGVLFDI